MDNLAIEKLLAVKKLMDEARSKAQHFICLYHGVMDCPECAAIIIRELDVS